MYTCAFNTSESLDIFTPYTLPGRCRYIFGDTSHGRPCGAPMGLIDFTLRVIFIYTHTHTQEYMRNRMITYQSE